MRLLLILLVIVFETGSSRLSVLAQGRPVPTVYPYGGKPEPSRKEGFVLSPLRFSKAVHFDSAEFRQVANFAGSQFEQSAFFSYARFDRQTGFIYANFIDSAVFSNVLFGDHVTFAKSQFEAEADFSYSVFDSATFFPGARFSGIAGFRGVRFLGNIDFEGAHFADVSDFGDVSFGGKATLSRVVFDKLAYFDGAHFDKYADFSNTTFKKPAYLNLIRFSSGTSFYYSRFDTAAYFFGSRFEHYTTFSDASFELSPYLADAILKDTVIFRNADFKAGVDLREARLDSLSMLCINEYTSFPVGKFFVDWDQLKGRIQLDPFADPSRVERDYQSLEIVYHKLRDNFDAQGEKASADGVMLELGRRRAEMLGEWDWVLYGVFFGWGYQPWRFLLFVVLPLIIVFGLVWYWFYFELVVRIVDEKVEQEFSSDLGKVSFPARSVRILPAWKWLSEVGQLRVYGHSESTTGLSRLSRYWHVIFFSASVLLDIRFKRLWLQKVEAKSRPGEKTLLAMITFEWLLGVGLYVTFALLVRGSRFEFIKGFLGF